MWQWQGWCRIRAGQAHRGQSPPVIKSSARRHRESPQPTEGHCRPHPQPSSPAASCSGPGVRPPTMLRAASSLAPPPWDPATQVPAMPCQACSDLRATTAKTPFPWARQTSEDTSVRAALSPHTQLSDPLPGATLLPELQSELGVLLWGPRSRLGGWIGHLTQGKEAGGSPCPQLPFPMFPVPPPRSPPLLGTSGWAGLCQSHLPQSGL